MSVEQRRHKRYDVQGVQGSLLYSLDARILNMSLTGMALETTSFLKNGGHYWLRVPHGEGQIRFKADVKWCKLVRNDRGPDGEVHTIYQAGIDFRDILDEHAREVLGFLQQHIVVELDRRLTGRFNLATPQHAALAVRHDFEVKRLSLGGMAVDTVWDPPIDAEVEIEIGGGDEALRGRARVRSVQASPATGPHDPPSFLVGLAFVGLDETAQSRLGRFVQSLLE